MSKGDVPDKPWRVTDEQAIFPGHLRKTLDFDTSNILIEAIIRVDDGQSGGTIASKSDGKTGYMLGLDSQGRPVFTLQSSGQSSSVAGPAAINDGKWHHVLGEFDRKAGLGRMYVDGRQVAQANLSLPSDASLSNEEDFQVGRGLAGAIDFLRVCQGTLQDAQTDIQELYAWQNRGPATRDFCGNEPHDRRDIGAVERVD